MSRALETHVGIRELAELVARAIAVELVLFEAFGRWISTTSQAERQARSLQPCRGATRGTPSCGASGSR